MNALSQKRRLNETFKRFQRLPDLPMAEISSIATQLVEKGEDSKVTDSKRRITTVPETLPSGPKPVERCHVYRVQARKKGAHCIHKPETPKLLEIKGCIFRFVES